MEYKTEYAFDILDKGNYNGYDYYIISYGTHPCAYIIIPVENPLYGRDYNSIDIDVHGGLTFGGHHNLLEDRWCIGWDYAHAGDCVSYSELDKYNDKRWTTEEILEDVHSVIDQLNKLVK